MCASCAMVAASAATGFRTWLHSHRFRWLTPKRMRALTIAAMCTAGLVSTVGFSGSTPAAVRAAVKTPPAAAPPHSAWHHPAAGS